MRKRRIGLLSFGLVFLSALPAADGPAIPEFVIDLIESIEKLSDENQPEGIWSYLFDGSQVFYVSPMYCCDITSDLYDENGTLLCHPDGGIAGAGDGRCPSFLQGRKEAVRIWPSADLSPDLGGVFTMCDSPLAGSEVRFFMNNRSDLRIFGDDGPWELVLIGRFRVDGDKIMAEITDFSSKSGPAPMIDPYFQIAWTKLNAGNETILRLDEVKPLPLGSPWFEIGRRYAKSELACE